MQIPPPLPLLKTHLASFFSLYCGICCKFHLPEISSLTHTTTVVLVVEPSAYFVTHSTIDASLNANPTPATTSKDASRVFFLALLWDLLQIPFARDFISKPHDFGRACSRALGLLRNPLDAPIYPR